MQENGLQAMDQAAFVMASCRQPVANRQIVTIIASSLHRVIRRSNLGEIMEKSENTSKVDSVPSPDQSPYSKPSIKPLGNIFHFTLGSSGIGFERTYYLPSI